MTKRTSLYLVHAKKGGNKIVLHFVDWFKAYDTATELMQKGCVVSGPDWPTKIETSVDVAVESALSFLDSFNG